MVPKTVDESASLWDVSVGEMSEEETRICGLDGRVRINIEQLFAVLDPRGHIGDLLDKVGLGTSHSDLMADMHQPRRATFWRRGYNYVGRDRDEREFLFHCSV